MTPTIAIADGDVGSRIKEGDGDFEMPASADGLFVTHLEAQGPPGPFRSWRQVPHPAHRRRF